MKTTRFLPLNSLATASFISCLAFACPTFGQTTEDLKLSAIDGGSGNGFGTATAIADGVLAIGAPGDDDNGPNSGSAYLFDAGSGIELSKLTPTDGATADKFGFSLAMSNDLIIVGAPYDDDNGADSGSVYFFDSNSGLQVFKIIASDGQPGDEFGFAVALDNGLVVIGAKRDDDNGRDSGSVYIFDANSGSQLAKLLPNDGAADDNFGEAVDIDGGIIAVGAHGNDDLGPLSGSAYLFNAQSGVQLAKLLATDGGTNDFFGSAIAIDGGVVAVGAWADSLFGDHSGSAYLFDVASGSQITKIVPSDGHDRDHFGYSISMDAGIVAIGADDDDDNGFNSGSAYLYDATNGTLIEKLGASDGDVYDEFGTSVAIANGVAVIGSPGDDDNGSNSGSAYLFNPFSLSQTGLPGGNMSFQVSGATPGGQVGVVYSFGSGAHVVTNPLTGNLITTGLSSTGFTLGTVGSADGEGDFEYSTYVPASAAGLVYVQAIDGTNDRTCNVLSL
ncbi:MAG: FG-GAP repeat protein [Planctomycetes bacterium]|nr:FG-GAP repeat protein [Planctomycetota bacterium]